jgi:hypothetical protein
LVARALGITIAGGNELLGSGDLVPEVKLLGRSLLDQEGLLSAVLGELLERKWEWEENRGSFFLGNRVGHLAGIGLGSSSLRQEFSMKGLRWYRKISRNLDAILDDTESLTGELANSSGEMRKDGEHGTGQPLRPRGRG